MFFVAKIYADMNMERMNGDEIELFYVKYAYVSENRSHIVI